jgi:hypothetical protein
MLAGATVMVTGGSNVTVAVAELPDPPPFAAVMVTVCCVVMLLGAVYSPAEVSVPGAPDDRDQAMSALHSLAAVNCWISDA